MAFKVINPDKRFAGRKRERLGCHHADHYPTDQAGA